MRCMSCACVYVRARALVHARECVHSACRALGQYEYGEGILKRTCKPAGAEMCCVIRSRVHPHTHHESDPCPTLPRAHSATLSLSISRSRPPRTDAVGREHDAVLGHIFEQRFPPCGQGCGARGRQIYFRHSVPFQARLCPFRPPHPKP